MSAILIRLDVLRMRYFMLINRKKIKNIQKMHNKNSDLHQSICLIKVNVKIIVISKMK